MQLLHGGQPPPDGTGRDEEGVLIHLGNGGSDGGNLIRPYHDGLMLILSVYL